MFKLKWSRRVHILILSILGSVPAISYHGGPFIQLVPSNGSLGKLPSIHPPSESLLFMPKPLSHPIKPTPTAHYKTAFFLGNVHTCSGMSEPEPNWQNMLPACSRRALNTLLTLLLHRCFIISPRHTPELMHRGGGPGTSNSLQSCFEVYMPPGLSNSSIDLAAFQLYALLLWLG